MKMHGPALYTVEYLIAVVKRDIPALPTSVRSVVKKAIEERLAVDPIKFGKPLRYSLKGHRRLRVGDWRIVYRIDAPLHQVVILAIQHRKEIYSFLRSSR